MTHNRKLTLAVAFTTILGGALARAEQLGHANVPFAFEVSGSKMAPGVYQAKRSEGGSTSIRNSSTGRAVYVMAKAANTTGTDQSSLTFKCYGNSCFLSKVTFGDSESEYQVPRSAREKELSASNVQPETRLVAMR